MKRVLAVGRTTPRVVTRWDTTRSYTKYRQTLTITTEVDDGCYPTHTVGRLVPIEHVKVEVNR